MSFGESQLQINAERLLRNINKLATFGSTADGGADRQALSPEDVAARKWLAEKAQALGFEVSTDALANLFIRLEGTENIAPLMVGSHIDTQPNGGHLDGCYGVLAAFECLQVMKEQQIKIRRPIEVVAWSNEEGCRFSPGAMGSSSFVDPSLVSSYLTSVDVNGVSVADAIADYRAVLPGLAERSNERPHQFIELHIEQGPVLESAGLGVGVVSGIQGVHWFEITCHGRSAHAGTTPHENRSDAMTLARKAADAIESWVDEIVPEDKRLTFGRWLVSPNAVNTIASEVKFTIDFRHGDPEVMTLFGKGLDKVLPQSCEAKELFCSLPVAFDSHLQDTLSEACKSHEMPYMSMPSGAFHDAMFLARCCPTGMLFVPSRDGISHNPQEYTEPQQLTDGANVLLTSLVVLANEDECLIKE